MVLKGLYFIVFNHAGYEQLAGAGSDVFAKPFRKHLLLSLFGSGLAIALAVISLELAGRFDWLSPVAWNKALAVLGIFFSAWGTWFGVTERNESWKKSRLDERLRDIVFIGLFIPGVIFSAVGTMW